MCGVGEGYEVNRLLRSNLRKREILRKPRESLEGRGTADSIKCH